MNELKWCLKQKRGLKLIESNSNLAEAYLKKAEEAMATMNEISDSSWKISTAYYAMYFSLYSLLQKIGIKSEIHKCTILFAQSYLSDYFSDEELQFLEQAMEQRVENQYYTNVHTNREFYHKVVKEVPKFYVKCKNLISCLTYKEIQHIRNLLNKN
ncbi:MAG: HEPN domain-containing protein [Candidatus Cloacimonetes bacterium]|nr:HEPN domain-containing protein [Candidatus Cloacimonadota bacterium]